MNIRFNNNQTKGGMNNVLSVVPKPRIKQIFPERLLVKDNEAIHIWHLNEILMIKAAGNYSIIYASDGTRMMVSKTLMHFDRLFSNYKKFMRTHRSYLVNVEYVRSIVSFSELKLEGIDEVVPLARSRRTAVTSFFEQSCIC